MTDRSATLLPFNETAFASELAELDQWRTALDARAPLIRSWEGQLRRDLQAEAVAASTSMEGVPVTVEEVRRILAGETPPSVAEVDRDLVLGYREAMNYALRRADDPVFEWSPELVKAIHDRVMGGRFSSGAGRYGRGRFVVDATTGELRFTPPPGEQVERLVRLVVRRINSWKTHPALRAAWIHVAIAAVHPFSDGNGRAARVLSSLAMYRGGFKRPELCSLEEWWGRHRQDYYDAFRCLGRDFDPSADVTPFVRAHLSAQLSQIRALDLRERTTRGIWIALENVCEDLGIWDRAVAILWETFNERPFTASYYSAIADISRASATADLRALHAAGLVAPRGETRARRYVAGSRLHALVGERLGMPGEGATRDAIIGEMARRLAQPAPAASEVTAARPWQR